MYLKNAVHLKLTNKVCMLCMFGCENNINGKNYGLKKQTIILLRKFFGPFITDFR
jgi:hypothetical protein